MNKMKIFKMSTFHDFGNFPREDVDAMICALVRFGYDVTLSEDGDYIQFNVGNDDEIKEKTTNISQ